jgi:hypothetical protein
MAPANEVTSRVPDYPATRMLVELEATDLCHDKTELALMRSRITTVERQR